MTKKDELGPSLETKEVELDPSLDFLRRQTRDAIPTPKPRKWRGMGIVATGMLVAVCGYAIFTQRSTQSAVASVANKPVLKGSLIQTKLGDAEASTRTNQAATPEVQPWPPVSQLPYNQKLAEANMGLTALASTGQIPVPREPSVKRSTTIARTGKAPCYGMVNCAKLIARMPEAVGIIAACKSPSDICDLAFWKKMPRYRDPKATPSERNAAALKCGGMRNCEDRVRDNPKLARRKAACDLAFSGRGGIAETTCDSVIKVVLAQM